MTSGTRLAALPRHGPREAAGKRWIRGGPPAAKMRQRGS